MIMRLAHTVPKVYTFQAPLHRQSNPSTPTEPTKMNKNKSKMKNPQRLSPLFVYRNVPCNVGAQKRRPVLFVIFVWN